MKGNEADARVVARCLAGDPAAFGELVGRYKNQVFTLLLRLVANSSDAEDLAQDAFLKAFRALASYDPDRAFLTWLFKIAHNTAIDFLRARKPQSLSLDDAERVQEIPEPGSLAPAVFDAVLQQALVERLLSRLPPLYQEALVLRHRYDLDIKELAQMLGLAQGTVKIRLFRGRELLKRALADETVLAGAP